MIQDFQGHLCQTKSAASGDWDQPRPGREVRGERFGEHGARRKYQQPLVTWRFSDSGLDLGQTRPVGNSQKPPLRGDFSVSLLSRFRPRKTGVTKTDSQKEIDQPMPLLWFKTDRVRNDASSSWDWGRPGLVKWVGVQGRRSAAGWRGEETKRPGKKTKNGPSYTS